MPVGEGPAFLAQLPVERIGGVGPRFAARLHAAGLHRAGEVARLNRAELQARLVGRWLGYGYDREAAEAKAHGNDLRNADRILVMERGRIVERGTHDELLERSSIYRELYRSQLGDGHRVAGAAGEE